MDEMEDSGAFNDRLLLACRREQVDRIPVWLMRQAGRYMSEYRKLKKKHSFIELSTTPELAAEVTMLPIDKLGVDAAILFCDLLTPATCAGFKVEYAEGGPFIRNPVKSEKDVERINARDIEDSGGFIAETVELLVKRLNVPLIGFVGAPFTMASYLVEGGPSKHFQKLKTLMNEDPAFSWKLFEALAGLCVRFMRLQVKAGAKAIQIFDTWAGALSPGDFSAFELPWIERMCLEVRSAGVPVIVYVNGTAGILDALKECGADVVSIDWRMDLADARKKLGSGICVQGNLDPTVLFAPDEVIVTKTREILDSAGRTPGYIFNLGHGILPQTEFEKVKLLVETVQNFQLK